MSIGPATFLQPALQPVFDKVCELGWNLLSRLTGGGLADEVKKWNYKLIMMQAVLADAEQRQFSDNSVKIWVRDLKEVTHDMEDVLEYLAIQADEDELKTLDQKVFGFVDDMVDSVYTMFSSNGEGIEEKVANITKCLEGIQEQTVTLQLVAQVGMQQQTLQTEALRSQRETSSVLSTSKIFGRDDIKKEIIRQLRRDNYNDQSNENYAMIPIVGMGGIGKTTLAQLLYNDEQAKYDLTAWVCVSDVFDVKRITTSIINEVDRNGAVEFSNLQQAQIRLMQLLAGKKFLIVLDDIWNRYYENWEKLQIPFQYAAKGSRVIMTTRNEVIAKLMNTNPNHDNITYLKGLSDDACWSIVQHHANNKTGLTEMRADIINKCKGLPLAAKVLGGILKKKDTTICQEILKSSIWSDNDSEILPVLRLSYHDLPSHLKRIFAYCSIFPKDYRFKEKELVFLCMAQGFLPSNNKSQSMAITGQIYLRELVSRSLLESVDVHEEGEMWVAKGFIMHDLIHDLALQAAGDIYHVKSTEDRTEVEEKRARHVFLTQHAAAALGNPFPRASRLRTLYFESNTDIGIANFDFECFSCIRALRIYSNEVKELPEGIGNLKYLRFLSLRCSSITKLPKSISKLPNLQTLCLYGCDNLEDVTFKKKLHLVRE